MHNTKKLTQQIIVAILLLILAAGFGLLLFRFALPMEDSVYNISASGEDGQEFVEDRGWTVFTQEGELKTELIPNGIGGFTGLSFPGQTFYFSRIMSEKLDSPTLRLGAVNRTVAVFLDGRLLYTDCPEQEEKLGTLSLPMLKYDRTEPVIVSLPVDYQGKTLTIAQSTDTSGGEKQISDNTVWPCDVTLYCGYAYESSLISESFRAAIPAALLFALGIIFLSLFFLSLCRGKSDFSLLCIALTAFLYMAWTAYSSFYSGHYPLSQNIDIISLCRPYALLTLLAFLSLRGGRYKAILWILTGLHGLCALSSTVIKLIPQLSNTFPNYAAQSELAGVCGLLAAIILGAIKWRKENQFYRSFTLFTIIGITVYLILLCLSPWFAPEWWSKWLLQFRVILDNMQLSYICYRLMNLTICATALSAVTEFVLREASRRTEAHMLAERAKLAQDNYENLRTHDEEVMMLRHDMVNHLKTLRSMTGESQTASYLDELIGQNEKIRHVIQSGNEMLDILLNGKLAFAAAEGITVEILRSEAPEKLPLTYTELSSLVLNIMDNAISAAAASRMEKPFLRMDMHCKSNFFVLICENSCSPHQKTKEASVISHHGLGLKIMRQIITRYEGLLNIEQNDNIFKLSMAIPLTHASR